MTQILISQLVTVGLPYLTAGAAVGIMLRDIYEAARTRRRPPAGGESDEDPGPQ